MADVAKTGFSTFSLPLCYSHPRPGIDRVRVNVSPLRWGSYLASFVRWQLSISVVVTVASVTSTGSAVERFGGESTKRWLTTWLAWQW